ncbi:MAG: indole-3-glycerol phosphate synthase TrpC [Termitinemataceae bacterium]|nr:MAG: indole-3-glycerol phosphate synthase TrpC [Termitinemataceae bacterium]
MDFDDIVNKKIVDVEKKRKLYPFIKLRDNADKLAHRINLMHMTFDAAIKGNDSLSFICEIKKEQPENGIISEDFPYLQIAKEYKKAGAAAISVLSPLEFLNGTEFFKYAMLPVLCKDFIIDIYQIYEAKVFSASAVHLIASILDTQVLKDFLQIVHELKMDAVVETHSESEIEKALKAGANIISVNNRDLYTFNVDLTLSRRLRPYVPPEKTFVSESGISTANDIKMLRDIGTDAVLIGDAIMRSTDKKAYLSELKSMLNRY